MVDGKSSEADAGADEAGLGRHGEGDESEELGKKNYCLLDATALIT